MNKKKLIKKFNSLEKRFVKENTELKSFISNILTDQVKLIERVNDIDLEIYSLKEELGELYRIEKNWENEK